MLILENVLKQESIYDPVKKIYDKTVDEYIKAEMFNQDRSINQVLIDNIKNNKLLIYTAFTGDYDELKDPEYIDENCDYICYTDNPKVKSDVWKIRPIDFCRLDNNRKAKKYKVFPHIYFPEYKYSFWIDASFKITGSIREYIYKFANTTMLNCIHPERNCVYDEAKVSMCIPRYPEAIINDQIKKYYSENMPSKYGMMAAGFIFRKHNDPQIISLMKQWWEEIIEFTNQDQLSLAYVLWKNKFKPSVAPVFCWENKYWKTAKKTYHHKQEIKTPLTSYNLIDDIDKKYSIDNEFVLNKAETYSLINDVKVFKNQIRKNSICGIPDSIFTKLYMDTGSGFNEGEVIILANQDFFIKNDIDIKIDLEDKNIRSLRLDPIEGLLCGLEVNKIGFMQKNKNFIQSKFTHNGECALNSQIVFSTLDPQIVIDLPEDESVKEFIFKGKISINQCDCINKLNDIYVEQINKLNYIIGENKLLMTEKDKLLQKKDIAIEEKNKLLQDRIEAIHKLENDVNSLNDLSRDLQFKLDYAHEHPVKHLIKKIIKDKRYRPTRD